MVSKGHVCLTSITTNQNSPSELARWVWGSLSGSRAARILTTEKAKHRTRPTSAARHPGHPRFLSPRPSSRFHRHGRSGEEEEGKAAPGDQRASCGTAGGSDTTNSTRLDIMTPMAPQDPRNMSLLLTPVSLCVSRGARKRTQLRDASDRQVDGTCKDLQETADS